MKSLKENGIPFIQFKDWSGDFETEEAPLGSNLETTSNLLHYWGTEAKYSEVWESEVLPHIFCLLTLMVSLTVEKIPTLFFSFILASAALVLFGLRQHFKRRTLRKKEVEEQRKKDEAKKNDPLRQRAKLIRDAVIRYSALWNYYNALCNAVEAGGVVIVDEQEIDGYLDHLQRAHSVIKQAAANLVVTRTHQKLLRSTNERTELVNLMALLNRPAADPLLEGIRVEEAVETDQALLKVTEELQHALPSGEEEAADFDRRLAAAQRTI